MNKILAILFSNLINKILKINFYCLILSFNQTMSLEIKNITNSPLET